MPKLNRSFEAGSLADFFIVRLYKPKNLLILVCLITEKKADS